MARPINRLAQAILILVLVFLSVGYRTPAPVSAAPVDRASSYVCLWYKVKRGDTLSRIGARYGVTVRTLMSVNGLRSTRIYVGQSLCIPRNNPQPQPGPWYTEYWNNPDQMGPPALTTNVSAVNFNWGWGSPSPIIIADYWSGRFSRYTYFTGGTYRFTLNATGGMRLWVDTTPVFDRYGNVGPMQNQVDVAIAAGSHNLRIDYVDRDAGNIASTYASFVRVEGPGPKPCPQCPPAEQNGPWYTEFYPNIGLGGAPIFVTTYNSCSFDWGWNPPAPGMSNMNWSARFFQYRYLPAGVYRFVARSDDGVRIWVDDQVAINQWVEQSARTVTGDVRVGAGTHAIKIEYFQLGGVASLRVYWEYLGP